MTIDGFRAQFSGVVLGRETEGYEVARAPWNGDIDRRPAVIAQCRHARTMWQLRSDSVVTEGLPRSPCEAAGTASPGTAVCEGGLMVDLSPMRNVAVDPRPHAEPRCGGGTTWADLDAATQAHGLATPGGVISHTGVGGLTLGGGIGWLIASEPVSAATTWCRPRS